MDHGALHERTRRRGVNPFVYWLVRAILQPLFHIYLRMGRIGREHIPAHGPVIIASNHRSFLDPFMIATMVRRPMFYVAKKELFCHPVVTWMLSALGAFPVDRGAGDDEMIDTAKAILARGGVVLMFPEGTRIRPGPLATPRRGVGRLALESGAPVVPVAVIGSEDVRKGWRIRPRKVRIRAGRPLRLPLVEDASPALAGAVTDRIWPCVMLQWEWLGGVPPIRRAAIIGAGAWGTSLAVSLSRAGFEVELGCRTAEQAERVARVRIDEHHLAGVELPDSIRVMPASELDLASHDLVCLAVPARSLPALLALHGERIPRQSGLLVLSRGLVPPLGTLPSAFVSERSHARAVAVLGGPARPADLLERGASVVLASVDRALRRQLADVLRAGGWDVSVTADVTGVELAGCATSVAVLAAATASSIGGPNVADAAAVRVFAEVDALARSRGGLPETFAGLAGSADLVATVVAEASQDRRAGELLARGVSAHEVGRSSEEASDAIDSVALLSASARDADLETPALDGLAALVQGRIEPEEWTATVDEPPRSSRPSPVRAA
jgi:glycerol-3-phosphate dehydrogenase (NAD(P)+)